MSEAPTKAVAHGALASLACPGGPNFEEARLAVVAYVADLEQAAEGLRLALAEIEEGDIGPVLLRAPGASPVKCWRRWRAQQALKGGGPTWSPKRLSHLVELAAESMRARSRPLSSAEIQTIIERALEVEFSTTGQKGGANG